MATFTGTAFGDVILGTGGPDTLFGLAGDDILIGGFGDDRLFGGLGDDILNPGPGTDADAVDGGPGIDTFDASGFAGIVIIEEETEAVSVAFAELASLSQAPVGVHANMENVVGSPFPDIIGGGAEPNILLGGAGDDVLTGVGGPDLLAGGLGADTFAYTAPSDGGDTITDFQPGVDIIALDRAGFWPPQSQPQAGVLTPNHFAVGQGPLDGDDWFTLGQGGTLLLDIDGSGPDAPLVLATFTTGTPLISDIFQI